MRQHCLGARGHGFDVDGECLLGVGKIEVTIEAADQDAGVVDEDADAARVLRRSNHGPLTACKTAPWAGMVIPCDDAAVEARRIARNENAN